MFEEFAEVPPRQRVEVAPGVVFGGRATVVVAGPCAVEDRAQLAETARAVRDAGAAVLRGGAFKPRTSPASFQGLGAAGLALLAEVAGEVGMPVVTEVIDPRDVELVARHAAMLQIGSRSMQNFPLLREVGRRGLPVLLKRAASATVDELLAAAEYVLAEGNPHVVLCERGVRGFERRTRYTLDLNAVPVLQSLSPLPVLVDPSHGTGYRALVAPMARAAIAAGADGLIVEVHPDPARALSDGAQALRPAEFRGLMSEIRALAGVMGRPPAVPAAVADRPDAADRWATRNT